MKKPTIRDLAKRVHKGESTLYDLRNNNKDMFDVLWLGYVTELFMKENLPKS